MCLEALRCLLFPPEITGGSENGCGSVAHGHDPAESSALPRASSPGIREVKAAVVALRGASLAVVEAVKAWRESQEPLLREEASTQQEESGARRVEVDEGAERPDNAKHERSRASGREEHHGRSPTVPHRQPGDVSPEPGNVSRCDPPEFLWLRRSDYEARDDRGPGLETPPIKQHNPPLAGNGEPPCASPGAGPLLPDTQGPECETLSGPCTTLGVNYLTKMTWDTDFICAPGSALAELMPPDARLSRNPFILAHNLDDAVDFASGVRGHRKAACDGGDGDGPEGPWSGAEAGRMLRAAAAIVEEERRVCLLQEWRRRGGGGRGRTGAGSERRAGITGG